MGGRIDIVIFLFGVLGPFFGHTDPELIATGWQTILSSLYILEAPFLKARRSFGGTRVP